MGTKGEETKAFIVEKASILFAQKGYKDVTMKDICEATNLSRGGLYRHYSSTAEIFMDMLIQMQKGQRDTFQTKMANTIPATKILDDELKKMEQEMQDAKSDLAIAMYEFCVVHKEGIGSELLTQQYENGERTWRALINYGIERGEFKQVDVEGVIAMASFSYEGVRMCSEIMKISPEITRKIIEQIRNMLVKNEKEA